MSNYILVHSELSTGLDHQFRNLYNLKYFDDTDGFYHYMIDQIFDDEEDIINHLDETTGSLGLDQEFILFENGKESPIFSMTPNDQITLREFEKFCFGDMTKENVKLFSQFMSESKKDKFPNTKQYDIDGFVVILGRDAISNDHITFNVAKDDDIWMHAKGVPGSHLIIKVKDKLPTESVIKQAAAISKKNSKAPKDQSAEIVYCKRKFVHKSSDMNPGQVSVDYKNAYKINI